ncbi:SEL1-like repeat protein [Kingella kingae]|nr:SEL1-like repeat protein [Kingella kingae]MDK4536123.1 SEL1-like repeat protein [Kingella kingae]MDK4538807.1 SEL1-like repeat protein [Kingella kingae]MDK4544711.1 SEL1-like repeat protein [Kingella kingae]MDK4546812.1 SEL1-like repeat protein [Kingella kingae]MDK4555077.1 SEL1-like repeat protein [Kingella kingae]
MKHKMMKFAAPLLAMMLAMPAYADNPPTAQSGLGYMYRQGLGVKQDYAKARALFEAAGIEGLDIVNTGSKFNSL